MSYWYGSGTLSVDIDVEVVCAEECSECDRKSLTCDAVIKETLPTDDAGNLDCDIECPKCNHQINVQRSKYDQ
jgi:hypothetical protein